MFTPPRFKAIPGVFFLAAVMASATLHGAPAPLRATSLSGDAENGAKLAEPEDERVEMAQSAYSNWVQQLTGAILSDNATRSWQQFLGLDVTLADAYKQRGGVAYESGDYRAAVPLLSIAHDYTPGDIELSGRLGFACKETGEYERALKLLEDAAAQVPENYYYFWWLSDTQRLLGRYDAALESIRKAKELAPEDVRESLQQYVDYTQLLAQTTLAWQGFEIHRDFAKRHEGLRRTRRAIAEYGTALALAPEGNATEVENLTRLAWTYRRIGVQYDYIKEPEVAVDYYLSAVKYYNASSHSEEMMRDYQNLALAYGQLARRGGADAPRYLTLSLDNWEKTQELAAAIKDIAYERYAAGGVLGVMAALLPLDDPKLVAQRARIKSELPWQGPITDYTVAEVALGELACRMKEGDFGGARVLLEMALPYYEQSQYLTDMERMACLYGNLAQVHQAQGHGEQALDAARKGVEAINSLRQYLDSEGFTRSRNEAILRQACAAEVRALVSLDRAEEALDALEKYKAQVRIDMLASSVKDEAAYTDETTEAELIEKRAPLLEKALAAARAESQEEETRRLEERLNTDKERLAWLKQSVTFAPAASLSLQGVPVLAASEALAALPEEVTLVHFILDTQGGVAVVAGAQGAKGVLLNAAKEEAIRAQCAAFKTARDQDPGAAAAALNALYDILIAPIRELLTTELLYISTDRLLQELPFEALIKEGAPLVESFTVAYAPSASYLAYAMNLDRTACDRLRAILSDDTAAENLNTPDGAFPGGVERFTGAEASESKAVRNVGGGVVLHLSGKGETPPASTMCAGLRLAPGDGQDGVLHAAELLAAALPATLLVLDRQGSVSAGELEAFSEGSLHAGVPAVLGSLWPVAAADSGALLTLFYGNLATMSKSQALREAKRAFRQGHPDSYAWAGFVLNGDYR